MQHRIEDAVVAGLNVLLSNARHSLFMFILDYIDMARLLGMEFCVAEKFLFELLDLLLPTFSECQHSVEQGAKFDITESPTALISLRCSEYL